MVDIIPESLTMAKNGGGSDHTHANQAVLDTIEATDLDKLDAIAENATANDTDANLKDRANHTGSQAISTVTGLQTALDGKEPTITKNTGFNLNKSSQAQAEAGTDDATAMTPLRTKQAIDALGGGGAGGGDFGADINLSSTTLTSSTYITPANMGRIDWNNTALDPSYVYYVPMLLLNETTITSAHVYMSAGDASATAFKHAIYEMKADGLPGNQLVEIDFLPHASEGPGIKDVMLASPLTLQPGWYYMAAYHNSPNNSLRTFGVHSGEYMGLFNAAFNNWRSCSLIANGQTGLSDPAAPPNTQYFIIPCFSWR